MIPNESNILEFKQSWQDSCLSTLSAFANTDGGTMRLGVDDSGHPVGVSGLKKLLEDLPNKILSKLGIIATVRSESQDGKDLVTIAVERMDVPISYNGRYHKRSGSTTQELNGKELTRFLVSKSISNWDEYPVPNSDVSEIDPATIEKFTHLARNRLSTLDTQLRIQDFLAKLNLMEGNQIRRAGILLFGKNVKKYFASAFIRIGRFDANNEMVSMDTIEGNLFEQIERCVESLRNKYLLVTSKIDGLYRKDALEFPESVIREAITNAVVHREYLGAHVQIKIFPDKMIIWNEGGLPSPLTVADLKVIHPSRPRNERIADVFFKAGLIETWGHGTLKMVETCREIGLYEPTYAEEFGGFSVKLSKDILDLPALSTYDLSERQRESLKYLKQKSRISNKQYQQLNGVSKGTATKELAGMVNLGLLERTGTRGAGTHYRLRPR
jgi:ATP-dependent DNA helicase RecG